MTGIIRKTLYASIALLLAGGMLAVPAAAGSRANPEVTDPANDTTDPAHDGTDVDIVAIWFEEVGTDEYAITFQLADLTDPGFYTLGRTVHEWEVNFVVDGQGFRAQIARGNLGPLGTETFGFIDVSGIPDQGFPSTDNGLATVELDYDADEARLVLPRSWTITDPQEGVDKTYVFGDGKAVTNATGQSLEGYGTVTLATNLQFMDFTAQLADFEFGGDLSIDDVSLLEGDAGTTDAVFTVSLSREPNTPVSVDFATADGTAQSGSDYTSTSGTLMFPVGVTSGTILVPVLGDEVNETDETFFVVLSAPVNASLADDTGQGTILNDDTTGIIIEDPDDPGGDPGAGVNDVEVVEGDAGTVEAILRVRLSNDSDREITVDYRTVDGTAAAGDDYVADSGTLTFPAGVTNQSVVIDVLGDVLDETDEFFTVVLENASNANISDSSARIGILDDDTVGISIDNVVIGEGAGTATFTVSLDIASVANISVDFSMMDGTASAGSDYVAATGTVAFAAGETESTIDVAILEDGVDEPDEVFAVILANATSDATDEPDLDDDVGLGTILDNDAVQISIDDVTVLETDPTASFTVSLSRPSTATITVDFATSDGTATAGSDYVATSGTLTFLPGQTSATVNVSILDDVTDEAHEFFTVGLSGASSDATEAPSIVDSNGLGTILDDDVGEPGGKVTGGGQLPGEEGAGDANFGFNVKTKKTGEIQGNLNFKDHDADVTIRSQVFTSLFTGEDEDGLTCEFSGQADVTRGGVTTSEEFTVRCRDAGEPGAGVDEFFIQAESYVGGGVLEGGNVQIHNA